MKLAFVGTGVFLLASHVHSFSRPAVIVRRPVTALSVETATMAASGVPPETSETSATEDIEIPTNLPSDCGMDYIPLATMLATGQLAEADQV